MATRAISTSDVRSIIQRNPSVSKELADVVSKLAEVDDREERKKLLPTMIEALSPEAGEFIQLTALREQQHRTFMNVLSKKLHSRWRSPYHDFSKDSLFFLASACYFDGGVKTEAAKCLIDAELKRHYVMESHHPEHELHTDKQCEATDIREMAADRLARNVQYGDGHVDMNTMMKHLPVFHRGETEAKRKAFINHVNEFASKVEKCWGEMFYFSSDSFFDITT